LSSIGSEPSTDVGEPNVLSAELNCRTRMWVLPGSPFRYDSEMPLGPEMPAGPESSLVSLLLPSCAERRRTPVHLVPSLRSATVMLPGGRLGLGSVNTLYCTLSNAPSLTA
jgi:hypothetical protein